MKKLISMLFAAFLLAPVSLPAQQGKAAAPAGDSTQYRSDDGEKAYESLPRFRLGQIVDSGISQYSVAVGSSEKLLPLPDYRKKVYAIIRVKLDPQRSISVHDFSLVYNYQAFDCVAVRPYQESFLATKRVFPASKNSEVYDMLFILDMPDFKAFGDIKVTLHYRLAGGGLTDVEVKLKNYDYNPIKLAAPPADDSTGANNNVPSST